MSPDQFASALVPLRPQLVAIAARKASCQPEDAEDHVSEAVRLALLILPQFNAETGDDGLLAWLTRIISIVILRSQEKAAQSVQFVPLEEAAEMPAPPPTVSPRYVAEQQIRRLPELEYCFVRAWLRGDSIRQIALDFGKDRHTVSKYLGIAFRRLRASVPISQHHTFLISDFDYCRKVTVYRKPIGVWPNWRHRHPADRVLFGNAYRRQPVRPVSLVPHTRRIPPLPRAA
jgi:DNA-directed RNA polymerase specialized sigma24 family protein